MEVRQRGLIAGFLTAALLVAPLAAEAKRAGGGKSHGMSRQAAPTQSYQQPRQATPVQQPSAPATAPAKSGPGVGGMVAAGVAGAAIGAVAANALADDNSASQAQAQEEKGGIPSWIWILLAAAVALCLARAWLGAGLQSRCCCLPSLYTSIWVAAQESIAEAGYERSGGGIAYHMEHKWVNTFYCLCCKVSCTVITIAPLIPLIPGSGGERCNRLRL